MSLWFQVTPDYDLPDIELMTNSELIGVLLSAPFRAPTVPVDWIEHFHNRVNDVIRDRNLTDSERALFLTIMNNAT